MHFRPSPGDAPASGQSFFFAVAVALMVAFFPGCGGVAATAKTSSSEEEVVGERGRRRELFQLVGTAARERLLRALAGTETMSGLKISAAATLVRVAATATAGEGCRIWKVSSDLTLTPEISSSFCMSSLENDSSTKFESHSSSAKSSYCKNIQHC